MPQDAYVWQRAWTDTVAKSVEDAPKQSGGGIREIVPLAAEVVFRNGQPSVIRPVLSYKALQSAPSCGLALRIGSFAGSFRQDDAICKYLTELALRLVSDAQGAGCSVSELQIDFDCAASKLAGYRVWVSAIRDALHALPRPVPVSITALPSWMNQAEFGPLAREAQSFVLQVHAVDLPKAGEHPVLCDPLRARQWAKKAASFGIPFRVALPTYTSLVAINREGKIMGVSSEGQRPAWPADYRVVTARADARQLAQLVQTWTQDRPANLTGLLWYRLPVSSDSMNWRWPTLAAVMKGCVPKSSLRVDIPSGNPSDIFLVNEGEQDEAMPSHIGVQWDGTNLVAADALNGFMLESASHRVIFTPTASGSMLAVGERRMIGWVRLETPTKIYVTEN
jgi:hypothetical protein